MATIEAQIIKAFSGIREVEAIYKVRASGFDRYYIFTSNQQYDDNLLDNLIDIERQFIHDVSAPDFRYIASILCPDYEAQFEVPPLFRAALDAR